MKTAAHTDEAIPTRLRVQLVAGAWTAALLALWVPAMLGVAAEHGGQIDLGFIKWILFAFFLAYSFAMLPVGLPWLLFEMTDIRFVLDPLPPFLFLSGWACNLAFLVALFRVRRRQAFLFLYVGFLIVLALDVWGFIMVHSTRS